MKTFLISLLVLSFLVSLGGPFTYNDKIAYADKDISPSLYYTQAELNTLKALKTAPSHSALWDNIQSWANIHLDDAPAARSDSGADLIVERFIETMVFMYHMTNDTTYADAAVNWMLAVSAWEDWYASGSTPTVSRCYISLGVSAGYYALHSYMSPADATLVRNKLIEQAGWLYDNYPAPSPDYSYSAHGIVIGTGVGIAALALGSEYEESSTWLDYSYTFVDYVLNGMGIDDGGWIEGPNYYTIAMYALIPYCDALKRIEGKDYFTLNKDFFSNTGYYAIYMTVVNAEHGQAKIQMEDATGSTPWNEAVPVDFTYKLASEYSDGYVQTFANNYAEQDTASSYIWKDPDLTALAYNDLPLHRSFGDIGYEIWRENWDNDSLIFLFKSGRSYNHAHPDQNTYAIYKNGEALTTGIGYASSWDEYKTTIFNNCITAGDYYGNDGKLYGYGQAHEPNDIGGAVVPIGTSGHIISTDYTETYYYVAGDASSLYTGEIYPETLDWPLYSSGNLEKWVRHVVFFPESQYFIIFDDIISPVAQQVNWWYRAADLFNDDGTDAPPSLTIDDDLITQVIGNNRLEIKMLEPSSGSFDYTIDSNTGLYYSEFSYILVWPSENTTAPKFLSVMTADDKLSTGSLQTTKVQQDNCLGVIVDNDKYRDLILFSTDGTPVNQNIELGGYYKSADGNSYVFNDTKVLANFNTYEVIRLEAITANRAPLLDPIGDKSILERNTLQFTISANDPDKDPLTYSASNLPPGAIFDAVTRTFTWTPSMEQVGIYSNVHFMVSDGFITDTENISIIVNHVNQSPIFSPIGNKKIAAGQSLVFTVTAIDPDNDPLTYSISEMPPGASFDPITRTFSWAPTESQIGTYANIRFEVSDGKMTTTEDIIITVIGESSLSSAWWFWLILGLAIAALTLVFVLWRRSVPNTKFP